MPVYPHCDAFLQLVRNTNPTYSNFKKSALAPLVAILKSANGSAQKVVVAINELKTVPDVTYVNKANKYKNALHFLQRTYPVPQGQWVRLGAQRSRALHFTQVPMPPNFNLYGPGMYGAVQRLPTNSKWVGATAQTVEDFIYTSPVPVGAVLIHVDSYQDGMDNRVDGFTVIEHMKSVLRAIQHCGGGACALHIGPTPRVMAALLSEFDACVANNVVVNELGHLHMGGFHAAFNTFVTTYATVVVMGFDANMCVHANLFGTSEYPANAVAGTPALTPITAQANVVTSRAVLVTTGVIQGPEYGPIQNY